MATLIDLINETLEKLADTSFSLEEFQKKQKEKEEKLNESIFTSDVLTPDDIEKAENLSVDDFYVFYVKNLNKH